MQGDWANSSSAKRMVKKRDAEWFDLPALPYWVIIGGALAFMEVKNNTNEYGHFQRLHKDRTQS